MAEIDYLLCIGYLLCINYRIKEKMCGLSTKTGVQTGFYGGGGGYSKIFLWGGPAPSSNPLPFYIPF